jgi:antitoxin ParD1/3/4
MEASMTSLNISLPEPMKAFIEDQVRRGAYSTPSEFMRELVREAQKRCAHEEEQVLQALLSDERIAGSPELERARAKLRDGINAKLLEALRGGEATDMTARDWKAIRTRVLGKRTRKLEAENGKRARPKARGGRR